MRWRATKRAKSASGAAVARQYRRLAQTYDRLWSTYLRREVELTARYLPHGRASALDVGCGTGRLLEHLAERDARTRLTGVDLTPEMLVIARDRLAGRAEVVHGDASTLPFRDSAFDLLVSSSVLHYLDAPLAEIVREWRRCLRADGVLVITDWCRDYLSMRLSDLVLRAVDPAHGHVRNASELRAALIEAGYRDVTISRHRMGWFWGMMVATASSGLAAGDS